MKVYISADMEGITGLVDAEDTELDLRVEEGEEMGQTEIGAAEIAVVGVGE